MTSRVREMGLLAAALGLVAFGLLLGLRRHPPAPRVDPVAAYDLIRLDEPAGHVEDLLGLPPGDYRKDPRVTFVEDGRYTRLRADHPAWQEQSWAFDKCELLILVNEDGVVVAKLMLPGSDTSPPTFLERLWDRVRHGIEF